MMSLKCSGYKMRLCFWNWFRNVCSCSFIIFRELLICQHWPQSVHWEPHFASNLIRSNSWLCHQWMIDCLFIVQFVINHHWKSKPMFVSSKFSGNCGVNQSYINSINVLFQMLQLMKMHSHQFHDQNQTNYRQRYTISPEQCCHLTQSVLLQFPYFSASSRFRICCCLQFHLHVELRRKSVSETANLWEFMLTTWIISIVMSFPKCVSTAAGISRALLICLREIMKVRLGRDIKQVCGEGNAEFWNVVTSTLA